MKIGIIGAMKEEILELKKAMHETESWEEGGARFFAGRLGGHEVVVAESGIGKVLAALTATLLISHYHVDVLLNTGSAGGIGAGLAIGEVVVGEQTAYYDADVTAFGYEMGQMAGMPLYYEGDPDLVPKVLAAAEKAGLMARSGLIVTGDSFIHSQEQINEILMYFPHALACEMEGAAIAQIAYQYHVPCVVIRAMSDNGDEDASVNFDDFIITAGRKSAEMVIAFTESLV